MTEEKNRGVVFPGDQQASAPSQPPPSYYGTFQGVANYPPYPPPPPTYQPSVGFPHPSPPPNVSINPPYYAHGYQTVPGIVIAPGTPVIIERTLPCCGCGIGWFLFFVGFFFGAIPWYIGAFILLCVRGVDYREKPGLVACTIAAFLALIAVGLGVHRYH